MGYDIYRDTREYRRREKGYVLYHKATMRLHENVVLGPPRRLDRLTLYVIDATVSAGVVVGHT